MGLIDNKTYQVRNDTVSVPRPTSDSRPIMQKTLKGAINCTGVALHSGNKVSMMLKPADPDTGIIFRRTDVQGQGAEIPARWDHVVDTRLCTVLGNDKGVTVSTVEHLMAALAGAGIDNAVIDINGPEVPIMDGSSQPFVFLIDCAGVATQDQPRKALRIKKSVCVDMDGPMASLDAADGFAISFEIEFESRAIARQTLGLGLKDGAFKAELARARTFGFLDQVEQLRAAGLARGGSLDNAVVVSGDKIMNEDGLRFDDEFVRHKILDAVGDLYLAGGPILGHFHGSCSGHMVNNKLLRAVFADDSAYEWVVLTEEDLEADPVFDTEGTEDIKAAASF